MKISRLEEYGLRCVLQLAQHDGASMQVEEVATLEGLSKAYVAKIMTPLRRAGIVESVRGVRGGYRLTRSPDKICLAEVLVALDATSVDEEFCRTHRGNCTRCVHVSDCGIRAMWVLVTTNAYQVLSKITLKQLIGEEAVVTRRLTQSLSSEPASRSRRSARAPRYQSA